MVSEEHIGQQFHAQVHIHGGNPPEYPHAFMPVCYHPDHKDEKSSHDGSAKGFWSGQVYRGNDTDSPGYHAAWDEAEAHNRRQHTSGDATPGPDYGHEDPFAARKSSDG